ncbi:hypothetical protein CASFOL_022302 [Castilleja foliolosa]|uniref:C2 NT-type domain-containing protein n=1 Tax=Castilleja foliolosa TaxID=1961234 RepID=A0ABD3CU56_9LAMI
MSSEAESTEREDEDLSCGLLLRDIEEISKALYLHETLRKPLNSSDVAAKTGISRSKSTSLTIQNLSSKHKKSSLWNWRPLKALSHIRNHRFSCCFFLHVHAIEALPPNLNDLSLCVVWNRKNEISRTRPVRARSGTAEFEETLMHRCTIYGSRSGGPSPVKYEPKIFSLRVSAVGPSSELEITNHRIDLSRLLPVTVEELLEVNNKKDCSGKCTTSFKLTGEAKGAMLNVSFGFSVLDGNSFDPGCFVKVPDVNNLGSVSRISSEEESEAELSHSVTLLYRKLDEKKTGNVMGFDRSPESEGGKICYDFSDADFDIIEPGIEKSGAIETIDVAEIFDGDETAFDDEFVVESNSKLTHNHEEHACAADEEYVSLQDLNNFYKQENHIEPTLGKSLISLDDVSESIENEFLNMLSTDQSQDDEEDDYDLSFPIPAVEKVRDNLNELLRSSSRNAKTLESLETEALMHEWGLTEKTFQYSKHASSGGFGSPVYIPADEPLKLPSIEEGVGPIIRTKDGGFLRSMSPLLFANANNSARLIVQVSVPVVLPPAMGFTVMEILRCWACGGVEKMCVQVNSLMPLEDVTGKTMQEVLSESESVSNGFNREALQCSESIESDYVTFEDLVPLAITNIEGLLVQGLKIQSGMPDQEAPSSSESASSLQVLANIDELIKQYLSLDEWIRLDSEEFRIQDETDGVSVKNFNMGLKVQLRDPFRNYEMVGPSMLALIQVDRVYENKVCGPLFKVSEVHLAGLNVMNGDTKRGWGTSRQQQSGSRWLFSSGMAKSSNVTFISNSTAVMKSSKNGLLRKAGADDVLWSISLPNRGEAATWDEQVALNVHVRNPDIIFSE